MNGVHTHCQCMKPEPIQIDRLAKRNLNEFIEILQSDCPLFCIDAVLSTPHILLQPTGIEVCNTIMQVVNGFLERYSTHKRFEFLAMLSIHSTKNVATAAAAAAKLCGDFQFYSLSKEFMYLVRWNLVRQ